MLPRLCKESVRSFRVVTADVRLTCRENAALVRELGKDYVFAVKGNQLRQHDLARSLLWAAPTELRSEERFNGRLIVRELARVCFEAGDPRLLLAGARQLWRVRPTTITAGRGPGVEDRYYITSLDWLDFEPEQVLALVRVHWGIENGHNWTMDVTFGEDDSQPCQQGKDAIEVIARIRILAYNLVAAWRARSRVKDGKPMPWRHVIEKLRDSLIHTNLEAPLATLG